jgi:hypothetical protein
MHFPSSSEEGGDSVVSAMMLDQAGHQVHKIICHFDVFPNTFEYLFPDGDGSSDAAFFGAAAATAAGGFCGLCLFRRLRRGRGAYVARLQLCPAARDREPGRRGGRQGRKKEKDVTTDTFSMWRH